MSKSIITDDYSVCYVEGCNHFPSTEHHLIFGNGQRPLSEKYGLKIPICYEHHEWCHGQSHKHPEFARDMKMLGQRAFEQVHGTREDFERIFRINYL